MVKTTNDMTGVIGVVNRARAYNSDIGNYLEHFTNESFDYAVRLSGNGAVTVSQEAGHDQEKGSQFVSEEQIKVVANSFRRI